MPPPPPPPSKDKGTTQNQNTGQTAYDKIAANSQNLGKVDVDKQASSGGGRVGQTIAQKYYSETQASLQSRGIPTDLTGTPNVSIAGGDLTAYNARQQQAAQQQQQAEAQRQQIQQDLFRRQAEAQYKQNIQNDLFRRQSESQARQQSQSVNFYGRIDKQAETLTPRILPKPQLSSELQEQIRRQQNKIGKQTIIDYQQPERTEFTPKEAAQILEAKGLINLNYVDKIPKGSGLVGLTTLSPKKNHNNRHSKKQGKKRYRFL